MGPVRLISWGSWMYPRGLRSRGLTRACKGEVRDDFVFTALAKGNPAPAILGSPRLGDGIGKSLASASCGSMSCASIRVSLPLLLDRRLPNRRIQACAESKCVRSPLEWLRL